MYHQSPTYHRTHHLQSGHFYFFCKNYENNLEWWDENVGGEAVVPCLWTLDTHLNGRTQKFWLLHDTCNGRAAIYVLLTHKYMEKSCVAKWFRAIQWNFLGHTAAQDVKIFTMNPVAAKTSSLITYSNSVHPGPMDSPQLHHTYAFEPCSVSVHSRSYLQGNVYYVCQGTWSH